VGGACGCEDDEDGKGAAGGELLGAAAVDDDGRFLWNVGCGPTNRDRRDHDRGVERVVGYLSRAPQGGPLIEEH